MRHLEFILFVLIIWFCCAALLHLLGWIQLKQHAFLDSFIFFVFFKLYVALIYPLSQMRSVNCKIVWNQLYKNKIAWLAPITRHLFFFWPFHVCVDICARARLFCHFSCLFALFCFASINVCPIHNTNVYNSVLLFSIPFYRQMS